MADSNTGVRALDATMDQLIRKARAEQRRRSRARGPLSLVIATAVAVALIALLVLITARGGQPPHGRAGVGVDRGLVDAFAVFRRPQTPRDIPARGDLHLGVGGRGGLDRMRARRVGVTGTGEVVYVVPGRDVVCLTGAGCTDIAGAVRGKGPVGFAQCGRGARPGDVQIFALLPDFAERVRVRRRDGREVPVAVHDNVLLASLPTRPASVTPTTIVWDGPRGHDATTLGGVAANLRCAP